jgi:ubiquinone/menaquinone biosynthesis C-methylase UbiE
MNPYLNLKNYKDSIEKRSNYFKNLLKKNTSIKLKKATVLDIGCGNGQYTFIFSKFVNKIYGIDPSESMLKSARNNKKIFNSSNIRFHKGYDLNIPFSQKFDIILYSNSLHFSSNVMDSLNNSYNFLKKDGILLIMEPINTFSVPKLNPNHEKFNKKIYTKKINILKKTKATIKKFCKDKKILYEHSKRNYIIIIS